MAIKQDSKAAKPKEPTPEQKEAAAEINTFFAQLRSRHTGLFIDYRFVVEPAATVKLSENHNTRPLGQ